MASVKIRTALSTSAGVFRVKFKSSRFSSVVWNSDQFTGPEVRVGLVGMGSGDSLSVRRRGEWSEDKSFRAFVIEKVLFKPVEMKKSKRSGILFRSEGQWVGLG